MAAKGEFLIVVPSPFNFVRVRKYTAIGVNETADTCNKKFLIAFDPIGDIDVLLHFVSDREPLSVQIPHYLDAGYYNVVHGIVR